MPRDPTALFPLVGHVDVIAEIDIVLMSEVGDRELIEKREHVPTNTGKLHSRFGCHHKGGDTDAHERR